MRLRGPQVPAMEKRRFEPKQFPRLKGLQGISDAVLKNHLELYAGYVKNVNGLNDELQKLKVEGKAQAGNLPYAELTRRLGFETNGMLLHELYFSNLVAEPDPLEKTSPLGQAFERSFGSVEEWLADFKAVAAMRGVGWAITFQSPETKELSNHWIELHQGGHPCGYKPVVVMDAWEHAFVPDYKPSERAKYVEAYFKNVDYRACEGRLIK